jgi:hypothetical protein
MPNSSTPPSLFNPEMPHIPGVNRESGAGARWRSDPRILIVAGLVVFVGVFVVAVGGWALRLFHSHRESASPSASEAAMIDPAKIPARQFPSAVTRSGGAAATINDLAKPWAAKQFKFVNPITHSAVDAMIVRLPGTAAGRSDAYWAFSLDAPYETCQLEYVTDLNVLASRYHFRASHPMVASSCDGTVYDPLRMGTTPDGAWARGEVVQGMGIRPPISIEVRVQGRSIVADRIE